MGLSFNMDIKIVNNTHILSLKKCSLQCECDPVENCTDQGPVFLVLFIEIPTELPFLRDKSCPQRGKKEWDLCTVFPVTFREELGHPFLFDLNQNRIKDHEIGEKKDQYPPGLCRNQDRNPKDQVSKIKRIPCVFVGTEYG